MTSNSKTAEPIQVAPYLTHVVSHHGRLTLIPPENAGRTRKTSKLPSKKEKKPTRRNGERSARSEDSEEARFNLGAPRPARPVTAGASSRRRPPRSVGESRSRGREGDGYGEDISIPDYPPPSFQEATSSEPSPPQTLSIAPSIVGEPSNLDGNRSTTRLLSTSPAASVTPAQRYLSIIVEPSTSLPASPNSILLPLPSLPPATSPSASYPPPGSESPLPPTPQSPGSDSDSDSQGYVCLPLEPSQVRWEEDRQLGLPLKERVQRELRRQRAGQADGAQVESAGAPSEPQSPTKAGPSGCKCQELLGSNRAQPQGRGGRATLQAPHPDWHPAPEELSLRSVTSVPSLTTQYSNKSRSPRSPLRQSSPISAMLRPYHSVGSGSSTLSLGNFRSFGKSTTSLGMFSGQTGGRERKGSRKLFSKRKGKERDKSFSDGDEGEEEALDSWEVVDKEPDFGEPGPSSKIRPRLSLKPHLKAFDISTCTYDEEPVEGRGVGENDTRVDPFPISAVPSSPETERPSSIVATPTGFYPPSATFSADPRTPASAPASSLHSTTRVLEQQQLETTRQRRGSTSMRGRPAPPPPAAFLGRYMRRPAPPPPPVRTGIARATPRCSPTSPTTTSPLSGVPAPAASPPVLRAKSPIPPLGPTHLQSPMDRRRTPPPPPPLHKTGGGPKVVWAPDPYDRALEIPLPPTPSDSISVRNWTPTPSTEMEHQIEREVGRRYGYAPGPHPYFSSPAVRPTVDYTHVPTVPSRLAVSIPTYSRSSSLSPRSLVSSPNTPRGHHYPGRPLPMTPGALSPVSVVGSGVPSFRGRGDDQHPSGQAHDRAGSNGRVPEALLIDFETEIEANHGSSVGDDIDRTSAAVENSGDLLSSGLAAEDEQRSVFESTGSSNTSIATSPVVASERPQFSEYTDLDILLARLERNDHNGTDYDTLLQVQEFIGPAAQQPNPRTISPTMSSALAGRIEIERRRVLKDGRVKLKLSLLGAAVDKCGICLSQFKEGELAVLGVGCRHAFHEKCLRNWLARSPTCPLCRVPLHIGGF